jgi:hypothetical protein
MVTQFAPAPTGAARRRAMAMVRSAGERPHGTALKPLTPEMLARAREQDFVGAILADIKAGVWKDEPTARARTPARGEDGVLELGLPIHREFALVLTEAHCTVFGKPRLDPTRIESAGFVMRRRPADATLSEGWMSAGARRRGWLPIAAGNADIDPDPVRRPIIRTGHPALDGMRRTASVAEALTEESYPLFVAPPDVCATLGKTVLYGVVPAASSETSEDEAPVADYSGMDMELGQHFGPYMAATQGDPLSPPFGGDADERSILSGDMISGEDGKPMDAFFGFLRLLAVECGAFDQTPQAEALRGELAALTVSTLSGPGAGTPRSMPADAFIQAAALYTLTLDGNAERLRMPARWPSLDAAAAARLRAAATACIAKRFSGVSGQRGKFEDPDTLYEIRPFIRVTCDDGCPARIIWAQESSAPFRILPWWAGGGQPAAIPLPDVMNAAVRRKLKPGVKFKVPASLANFLNQDHKKTLGGGKLENSSGLSIDWICSFSIPIITICAFIVLSIVIALLNIVFRWIPLVRICLPIPKKDSRP